MPRYVVYPGDIVYTVKDNRLKIKEVNILRSYKDSVIINEGLSEGELVVKTPLSSVKDGMSVRLEVRNRQIGMRNGRNEKVEFGSLRNRAGGATWAYAEPEDLLECRKGDSNGF